MRNRAKSKYRAVKIWYFSGTGNARFAAEQIAKNSRDSGIETNVYNIADEVADIGAPGNDALVGFCFPTHGFNAPPIVLKFLRNFPRGKADVFLLNTRGGLKLSKIHLPGIGGLALWLTALILLIKGYKPIGFRPLDMPSNWISIHPGLRKKAVKSIQAHCTITLKKFSNRILQGKWVFNGFLWLPIDIFIAPISIAYYWYGRFALAKSFFANTSCNNCNLCIDDCPVNAIIEKDGRPFWTLKCESCMHCMNICPQRSIEIPHAYIFPIWWLAFSAVPYGLIKLLVKLELLPLDLYLQYADLIFYFIMIPVAFIIFVYGYSLLHWLLGFKTINKIITYTSLTHYKWWRRYHLAKHK
jgi:Pyruvate/2-oxoacid:ferredoxin oxidoreductase delta subunit